MRKTFLSIIILLILSYASALKAQDVIQLSNDASVSVLTCAPYEEEVFTVYGHAAMRVKDQTNHIDLVFNYGIFSFDKPNFIYRFAKGETDYELGVIDYRDYVIEYQMRGSDVHEQELNLTQPEKQHIWELLVENYKPENRTYRYNFFFDNCATRLITLVEKSVQGKISYVGPTRNVTFRDMINYCTRNHPWLTFGCDLALGSPTDREANAHQQMFLPDNLRANLTNATVTTPDGQVRKVVKAESMIQAEPSEPVAKTFFTPLNCALILLLLVIAATALEIYHKKYFIWMDALLFAAVGIGGIVIAFLTFFSEHPCTCPNWNLIYFHPLHLVAAVLFFVKKLNKVSKWYHFINFAALTLMLIGWYFIPQHFNMALIPLVAVLWLRSGCYVYRKRWKKE